MNEQHSDLTPTRPYLLRAMHEWMSDNGQTPLILVDALAPDVQVPESFIEEDRIVLNISWSATRNLELGNDFVSFEARFNGTPHVVSVPMAALKGIYARESGQGMMFQDEPQGRQPQGREPQGKQPDAGPTAVPESSDEDHDPGRKKPGRPGLRLVK